MTKRPDVRSMMGNLARKLSAPATKRKHPRKVKAKVKAKSALANVVALVPKTRRISETALGMARIRRRRLTDGTTASATRPNPFTLPVFPKGVGPGPNGGMAMDEVPALSWAASQAIYNGAFWEGQAFFGYTLLAELSQRPEYRRISERIATEATRKWIKLQVTTSGAQAKDGDPKPAKAIDANKAVKLKRIEDAMKRLKVQDRFRELAEQDGFFGRAHLYLDTGDGLSPEELKTSIGDGRSELSKTKVNPNKPLIGLRTVEASWCSPSRYNSSDPLDPGWYKPEEWYVMARTVHATRLLTFVGREVPDLLKPAYAFGGLSLTQMAKPYVDNWLRTRQSVSDLVASFSTMILQTDLMSQLAGDGQLLYDRLDLYNLLRDNHGVFALNKDTEEFKNVTTPLGTLDALQAQSQEQMASVCGIPIVILLGIQPMGLNACLTGDTLIETDQGHVPIRDVHIGQKVMTRNGWAPIAKSGCTGYATELIEISTSDSTIRCTADHRIWLPSINAFVPAENVRPGDLLLCRGAIGNRNTANQSHIEAGFGGTEGMAITPPRPTTGNSCFTERFGWFITDLYRKVITSITSTETARIISSIISKCCRLPIMPSSMALPTGSLFAGHFNMSASVDTAASGLLYRSPRELNFAAIGAGWLIGGETEPRRQGLGRSVLALCAAFLFRRNEQTRNFVLGNVQRRAKIESRICQTTTKKIVRNGSNGANVEMRSVVSSVRRVPAQEFVYDIQVADGCLPEFFANGICVHNSSEGEIRVFYDLIAAYQEAFFSDKLTRVIDFIQLSEFGEVDPEITFRWEPLWSLDAKGKAEVRKLEAETDQILIDAGTLHPEESRKRIASDPDTPYASIDVEDVPDPPDEGDMGEGTPGGGGIFPGGSPADGAEAPEKPDLEADTPKD